MKLEKGENSVCNTNSVVFEVIFDISDFIAHFNLYGITVEIVVVAIVFGDVSPFEIVCISTCEFLTVVEIQLVRRDASDVFFKKEVTQTCFSEYQIHFILFTLVFTSQTLNRTLLMNPF